ncbi:MAG TPA: hypothetical protein VM939_04295, partial [Gemmatimonadaceae bacterium]|nr:hypothetical protein [Gemmatimonadaceae bacterium]
MLTIRRVFTVMIVAPLFAATPGRADAQAEVLTGLLGNATDFNFFWTQVGSPRGDLRPERSSGASGVGFEFAFEIPGSVNRPR